MYVEGAGGGGGLSMSLAIKGAFLVESGKMYETIRARYRRGFVESLKTLRDMIKDRTPRGGSLDLYYSIKYEFKETTAKGPYGFGVGPLVFEGKVYSGEMPYAKENYAAAVEEGIKPTWIPWQPLMTWIDQILHPPDLFTRSLWIMNIWRHIAKTGTHGAHMFRDGKKAFVDQDIYGKNMRKATEDAAKIMASETPWWARW